MIRFDKLIFILLDYELVAEDKECSGEEVYKANAKTVESCAQYCKSIASMFLYHNNENNCYCETSTISTGRCELVDLADWKLYEIKYPGN